MTKYLSLGQHLDSARREGKSEVLLTIEQIERIIGLPLPMSARNYRAWWANEARGRHVQARAWTEFGWQVVEVNLASEMVRFSL